MVSSCVMSWVSAGQEDSPSSAHQQQGTDHTKWGTIHTTPLSTTSTFTILPGLPTGHQKMVPPVLTGVPYPRLPSLPLSSQLEDVNTVDF